VYKIIIINRYFHPDMSATSQMASDLAFSLAASGIRVCVVSSRLAYEDTQAQLPKRETARGVDIHRIWTTRFGRMNLAGRAVDYASFYMSAFIALLLLARANDIVVAKTDPPLISVVAWIAAGIKRARLVNWLQDMFPEVAVALGVLTWNPLVAPLRWLRNLSLRGAVMNVAIGQTMQRRLIDLGIRPDTTTVIQNWADGQLIRPVNNRDNRLRSAWKLQDRFVIGYSGNMGRSHEFDTIIDAMMRLRDDARLVFLFIGGGAGKKKLQQACKEHGISNCLFMPYQEQQDLAESLSIADVHLVSLLPALEGLIVPSKLYGIAAAGRPVVFVGAADGEIARLVEQCKCGYSISCGNGERLAGVLKELADIPDAAHALGQNGRDCLDKQLDKSHAMQRWTELLDSVATGRPYAD
jgi:glycosyltransferase involved in cell wall biosynthesis